MTCIRRSVKPSADRNQKSEESLLSGTTHAAVKLVVVVAVTVKLVRDLVLVRVLVLSLVLVRDVLVKVAELVDLVDLVEVVELAVVELLAVVVGRGPQRGAMSLREFSFAPFILK